MGSVGDWIGFSYDALPTINDDKGFEVITPDAPKTINKLRSVAQDTIVKADAALNLTHVEVRL